MNIRTKWWVTKSVIKSGINNRRLIVSALRNRKKVPDNILMGFFHVQRTSLDVPRLLELLSDSKFVAQAIPLYMKSDVAVFEYFRHHRKDINAITGDTLLVPLPVEVETGNASAIGAIFGDAVKNSRYPGLLRRDLPCLWLEDEDGCREIIPLPNSLAELNTCVRALTDAVDEVKKATGPKSISAKNIKASLDQHLRLDAVQRSSFLRALLTELPMSKSSERLLALIFGVVFVAAILTIALVVKEPTQFQYTVFRIVLSIAAAGFVSMTPGFLQVAVSNWIRAGGALAVFVIIYFWNPAALMLH
jgi:hypothetical protein